LETICLKCLEKEPERRYATAQALADDLDRFLNHEPVAARPIGNTAKSWRWCRRQPVRAALTAALVVVFVAGSAGVLWEWRQAQGNAAAEARQQYDANIALAQSLIQDWQFDLARDALLARTPESYHGWEWGWLLRSCNQDLMTLSDNPSLGVKVGVEAAFSPDSRFLVTSGFDPVIWIWDLATGKPIRALPRHAGLAGITPFSPDGRHLCTFNWTGSNATVQVWDMETGQPAFAPLVHTNNVFDAAFSGDGRRLVTACADGKVRVYDAATGADTGLVNNYGDAVNCVEFSPDGRRIAYAGGSWSWPRSQDTNICIWDLATGETKRLPGHAQEVSGVTWSPDGKLLVSCVAQTARSKPGTRTRGANCYPLRLRQNSALFSASPSVPTVGCSARRAWMTRVRLPVQRYSMCRRGALSAN
jgi:WD40 repeat protein